MASSSTSNQATNPSSRPPSYDGVRQQAGPLPSKRGELGFVEGVHVQVDNRSNTSLAALPERHPADRDAPPSADAQPSSSEPNANQSSTGTPAQPAATPSADSNNKPGIFKFLKPKCGATLGGIRLSTFLALVLQLLILAACIVGWVFTSKKVADMVRSGGKVPGGTPSTIFIHAVFAFVVIGQLVFLERRIYRCRAERYAFLHPGEMLPRYRDRVQRGGDLSFAYAPWNRPPLPTYAAALAQSGHGTGDVDDHLIAVPPPPAYGNTRGSRLLLQGFLTEELRRQRPVSVHTQADLERGEGREGDGDSNSTDQEGNRERRREEALAQLENSRSRN
ncbi:hypothetical protein CC1G_11692 [Coprinopsis cinerea okayama7|uniref:Uncharacterized protein n=1 Tax=Coprinopsis cinerea (strain Okayama-7 / 130 / ATCC MYA-4618 / FGSC 9003) TaxID=240176 RepID=A8NRH9_COPC7|nr:hypothetical protein CC1G_11692 [Coprinopsis cinerea okayama7\|eukprot:XP_001835787.1 hypothetical protein CC1G_11692 [Coprinopsis cinerea okayama7\